MQGMVMAGPSCVERLWREHAGWLLSYALSFLGDQADQVVSYRNRLQERGLSPGTIRLRLAAVSGLFGGFVVRGELAGNPADPKLVRSCQSSSPLGDPRWEASRNHPSESRTT